MAPHAVEWKTSKLNSIVEYLIDFIIIGPICVKMDVKHIIANDVVKLTTLVRIREDKIFVRHYKPSA